MGHSLAPYVLLLAPFTLLLSTSLCYACLARSVIPFALHINAFNEDIALVFVSRNATRVGFLVGLYCDYCDRNTKNVIPIFLGY